MLIQSGQDWTSLNRIRPPESPEREFKDRI